MENKTERNERDIRSFKTEDQKDIVAVNAVLSGNKEAFGRIASRYRPYLVQKYFLSLGDREAAEDMASDVLVKAYENLRKYRMTHTFNSWITKIASNHLIDSSRRGVHKLGESTVSYDNSVESGDGEISSFAESIRDMEASADSLTLEKERSNAIAEGMATLSETGRMLIGMFYGKEMSYEEIAAETGMNMGTLKPNLMQAKRQLAEYISRKYPELAKRPLEKVEPRSPKVESEVIDNVEVDTYYVYA